MMFFHSTAPAIGAKIAVGAGVLMGVAMTLGVVPAEVRADSGPVAITEENFPDAGFRKFVADCCDTDMDGMLSAEEIDAVTELAVDSLGFKSLKGIEFFKSLKTLGCSDNPLKDLDLTGNPDLVDLQCFACDLMNIDLSKCTKLENLIASENNLSSLDLSKCESLKTLICESNSLGSLNLSGCPNIEDVNCSCNDISKLDIRNCSNLKGIQVDKNQLAALNVSQCPKLEVIMCSSNRIQELDLSQNPALTSLVCSGNEIAELDMSSNPLVYFLSCDSNCLEKLDISKCTKMETLDISDTLLTSVDLSNLKDLSVFFMNMTPIESIDLTNNAKVYRFCAAKSKLKELNIFPCEGLRLAYTKAIPQIEDGVITYEYEDTENNRFCLLYVDKTLTISNEEKAPEKDYTFEGFIDRLYSIALDREPEQEGKEFWVKKVKEEGATGGDCARFFLIDAEEFQKRSLELPDMIEILYRTFFDRPSDQEGMNFWLKAVWEDGMSISDVVNCFIDSREWCDVCATYGVKSGAVTAKATIATEASKGFITRLYQTCLNREPEEAGLKYWSLALTNLETTGIKAANFFFGSDEFKGFNLSDEEYIKSLYSALMDRTPDAKEVEYWKTEMKNGKGRDEVINFFLTSKEFTQICRTFGIDRGEI